MYILRLRATWLPPVTVLVTAIAIILPAIISYYFSSVPLQGLQFISYFSAWHRPPADTMFSAGMVIVALWLSTTFAAVGCAMKAYGYTLAYYVLLICAVSSWGGSLGLCCFSPQQPQRYAGTLHYAGAALLFGAIAIADLAVTFATWTHWRMQRKRSQRFVPIFRAACLIVQAVMCFFLQGLHFIHQAHPSILRGYGAMAQYIFLICGSFNQLTMIPELKGWTLNLSLDHDPGKKQS